MAFLTKLDGFKTVKMKSFTYKGEDEVYDLSVDTSVEEPHFIANGIVVHNSSQRMRDRFNKNISTEQIKKAVRFCCRYGYQKVKLFMIGNPPMEEGKDRIEFVHLMRELKEIRDEEHSNCDIKASYCIAEGQRVLTSEGYVPVETFNYKYAKQGQPVPCVTKLVTRDGVEDTDLFSYIGVKKCVRITSRYGASFVVSDNEPVLTSDGFIDANLLEEGMKLSVQVGQNLFGKYTMSPEDAWFYGYLLGDGCIMEDGVALFVANHEKEIDLKVENYMKSKFGEDKVKFKDGTGCHSWIVYDTNFARKLKEETKGKRAIPEFIYRGNREVIINFVRGFFDSEGSVPMAGDRVRGIVCNGIALDVLYGIKVFLDNLGIHSAYRVHYPRNYKGGETPWNPIASVEVLHSFKGFSLFRDIIGFTDKVKSDKLDLGIQQREKLKDKNYEICDYVVSVDFVDDNRVYDFQVPGSHTYALDGIVCHNCNMVITPNTPMQFFGVTKDQLEGRKMKPTIKALKKMGLSFRFGSGGAYDEAYFQQALLMMDRRFYPIIKRISTIDGFSFFGNVPGGFKEKVEGYMKELGLSYEMLFHEKSKDHVFAHDVWDIGVRREWFWDKYQAYKEARTYKRCKVQCSGCGACSPNMRKLNKEKWSVPDPDVDIQRIKRKNEKDTVQKILMKVTLDADHSACMRDVWKWVTRRAVNLAEIPINKNVIELGSDDIKLPIRVWGTDYVEVKTSVKVTPEEFVKKVEPELKHLKVVSCVENPPYVGLLRNRKESVLYRVVLPYETNFSKSKVEWFKSLKPLGSELLKKYESMGLRDRNSFKKIYPQLALVSKEDFAKGIIRVPTDLATAYKAIWLDKEGNDLRLNLHLGCGLAPQYFMQALFGVSFEDASMMDFERVDYFAPYNEGSTPTFFDVTCPTCGAVLYKNLLGEDFQIGDKCLKCVGK